MNQERVSYRQLFALWLPLALSWTMMSIAGPVANAGISRLPEPAVNLAGLTPFQVAVLTACRQIRAGQTTSYGKLAETIRRPAAARAVGNALSANPLPLIIPCHRVLAANGKLGGFSAPGGIAMKERMLAHERMLVRCYPPKTQKNKRPSAIPVSPGR